MTYTQFAFTVSEMAAARRLSWSATVETDQNGRHWSGSVGPWSATSSDPTRTLAALTHAIGLPMAVVPEAEVTDG